MKRFVVAMILFAPTMVAAAERDMCPFSTNQQVQARDAVDKKMGGRAIDSWLVAGGSVKREEVDKARRALIAAEAWAMDLTDEQLKQDYLCAVMLRRRGIDDAAREFVDGHTKKAMDAAAKKSIQTLPEE